MIRHIYLLATLLCCFELNAQDIASPAGAIAIRPGDKGKALVAALNFSSALNDDSIRIAGCTAAKAVGESDYADVVRPAFRNRLSEPKAAETQCAIWHFQEPGKVAVFLDHLVQIRRESTSPLVSVAERLGFEVQFQLLRGRAYREWHRVTVRPEGFHQDPDGTRFARGWRVIRYEVTGFEWMHEQSSSSGPIR
jgi:hypothetical protein